MVGVTRNTANETREFESLTLFILITVSYCQSSSTVERYFCKVLVVSSSLTIGFGGYRLNVVGQQWRKIPLQISGQRRLPTYTFNGYTIQACYFLSLSGSAAVAALVHQRIITERNQYEYQVQVS